MSFAFGFGGDDIEDGNDNENDDVDQRTQDYSVKDATLIPPKTHTLRELLSSLPSQVSYNLLPIPGPQTGNEHNNTVVPRRSVFDIRQQLMVEANPEENDNDTLLSGLEQGDLTTGIYEGGFKTWECSIDLASLIANLELDHGLHIIELGAGSAIPTLVALQSSLSQNKTTHVHFTLCDYNEEVLRLGTAPNIFLAEAATHADVGEIERDLDIEDIDQEKIEQVLQRIEARNCSVDLISGAWGEEFLSLIPSPPNTSSPILILASETIYSPETTKIFTRTLIQLLQRAPQHSKAWVAAKKVYFGVGGGVDDFIRQVEIQNGTVRTLLDVQGVGVGRVVLEITVGR